MPAALVVAMSDFLSPDDGPGQSGEFRVSPTFFLVLLGLGFVIGTLGHVYKSRTLQAAGIRPVVIDDLSSGHRGFVPNDVELVR